MHWRRYMEKKRKQYRAGDDPDKTISHYFEQKLSGIEVPPVPKQLPPIEHSDEHTAERKGQGPPVLLRVAAAAVFVLFTLPLYLPEGHPNELAQAVAAVYQKNNGPDTLKSSFGTFQRWVRDYYEK